MHKLSISIDSIIQLARGKPRTRSLIHWCRGANENAGLSLAHLLTYYNAAMAQRYLWERWNRPFGNWSLGLSDRVPKRRDRVVTELLHHVSFDRSFRESIVIYNESHYLMHSSVIPQKNIYHIQTENCDIVSVLQNTVMDLNYVMLGGARNPRILSTHYSGLDKNCVCVSFVYSSNICRCIVLVGLRKFGVRVEASVTDHLRDSTPKPRKVEGDAIIFLV